MGRLAGIVLCGGQSQRMGRDKAELDFGGESILNRCVRTLSSVAGPVLIAAGHDQALPPMPQGVLIIRDAEGGKGPLAAFARALGSLPVETNRTFLIACDLPLITPNFLKLLRDRPTTADAIAPFVSGIWHPLAAVYSCRVHSMADRLVTSGVRSMHALLDAIVVEPVTEAELQTVDPSLRCLHNVNTPEDYAAALREIE